MKKQRGVVQIFQEQLYKCEKFGFDVEFKTIMVFVNNDLFSFIYIKSMYLY